MIFSTAFFAGQGHDLLFHRFGVPWDEGAFGRRFRTGKAQQIVHFEFIEKMPPLSVGVAEQLGNADIQQSDSCESPAGCAVGKGIVASEPFLSLFAGRGNQAVGVALAIVGGVSCRLYARTGDPELLTNKRLHFGGAFFVISKHRANQIFHKFTFLTWLQQILILDDSSQCTQQPPHGGKVFIHTKKAVTVFTITA